eukprot:7154217-Pyramimonas_sp.AAC.1
MNSLPDHLKQRLLVPIGSRQNEWFAICVAGPDGRKQRAFTDARLLPKSTEIYSKIPKRIIPSRWHDKWTYKRADYDRKLSDPAGPKNYDATSRWIVQVFHDPDPAVLSRTVP